MKSERGETKVFDFGPPLEELQRRCLDETGLPPPKPPRFRRN
jgi:N-methylhydantoinase B